MGIRHLVAIAGLVSLGLMSSCAQAGGPHSGTGAAPGGSMSATPSASAPGSGGPTSGRSVGPLPPFKGPTPNPPGKGPEQTLTGLVRAGVEAGCLLLNYQGKDYLLMSGDPREVYAGAEVVVTGHVVTGIMTYCMQGVPFEVTGVHKDIRRG